MAGAVLSACDDASVPWHRIVRADGSLAKGERQRVLLEREGVPFRGTRVDLRRVRLPD
jgi:alkylated DNA nucleotide flippase Atl1